MNRALAAAALAVGCAQLTTVEVNREPPPRPSGGCLGEDMGIETFAIDAVDLGESDWQTLGYDLDGMITTVESTNVCVLHAGAPLTNQADGNGGIDNAFGALVVPTLASTFQDPELSTTLTNAIRAGAFTLQILVVGLDDTPTQTCNGLVGQAFPSDALGAMPTFGVTTDWPVLSESLNDATNVASGSKYAFRDAYVQSGTVVIGESEDVTLPLHWVLRGVTLDMLVHHALLTFRHPTAQEATDGVLAGVLDPDELIAALEPSFPKSCCVADFDCAEPIRQFVDILSDRTNAAGVPCDAISFAVGFHARKVANPTKVAAPLPPPPPGCP